MPVILLILSTVVYLPSYPRFLHWNNILLTKDLHTLKSKGCQLERPYIKSRLTVHLQMHEQFLIDYNNALKTAKSSYYSQLINDGSGNPKTLLSIINALSKKNNVAINSNISSIPTSNLIYLLILCPHFIYLTSFMTIIAYYISNLISKMWTTIFSTELISTSLLKMLTYART